MEDKILILSGEIGTGKTTALINWINSRNIRAHGVLMPLFEEKRHFYNPYMDVTVAAESDQKTRDPEKVYEIGPYIFSKKAFRVASSWLRMKPPLNTDYYIVDEVGHLELKDEGLEPDLSPVVKAALNHELSHTLILVVRKSLLDKVRKKYKLTKVKVIGKDDLENLD